MEKWFILKRRKIKRSKLLDSTIIKNGKFEFKGKIDRPIVYGIYIEDIKRFNWCLYGK